ncbi:MAG: hypothetical protein Q7T45_21385 [Bradyrhizobium sp.]|uniref:hypothetical protein n=1 Tax=Bradyrhizobium sp. TaxID=376 RepID=UPI0027161920|nr:hypothetical protein [Bradyrhizobium sp.]MDO8400375.1 hypothetical protein [Bradyrhizobium sp.]
MYRTRLSRALLATLAVAALASGSTLLASDTAQAGRIDPGFNRGPPRIDPGFGNGPTRIDPGFNRNDTGPKYTLGSNCHWIQRPGPRYRPGTEITMKVCN